MSRFEFSLRRSDELVTSTDLSNVMENWQEEGERWLFVGPHDDDIVLGGGLLMQKAQEAGIPIANLIVTDGAMGYCTAEEATTIQQVREKETRESFKIMGTEDVEWFNFPDGSLHLFAGRRAAKEGDPCVIKGFTGLQNAFTKKLRDFRPTRIFVPGGVDYHPDHKITYQELLISVFHAAGDIWPELGETLPEVPRVYEMAIYCDFEGQPNLQVKADNAALSRKVDAILAYKSQTQIGTLVDSVKRSGSVEYFKDIVFTFYSPARYASLF
jgi:LmbE family N-acetylglucosaminyl deacetylase